MCLRHSFGQQFYELLSRFRTKNQNFVSMSCIEIRISNHSNTEEMEVITTYALYTNVWTTAIVNENYENSI